MQRASDRDLLDQFARHASEEAFGELVRRYIGLVYSVALRHTDNPDHAEEITQAVFIILARKAASIGGKTILGGWLYHAARLTAANFRRSEFSRIRREQEAFMQSTLEQTPSDSAWRELVPLLDRAMAQLGVTDRNAVVLRYFENKTLSEVGAALGLEERAAQKRVSRALEKLHRYFNRRGVNTTTGLIAGAISAHSVQAAPPTLIKSVTTLAVAKGAAASNSTLTLIKGALKIMAWTKAKTAIMAGVVVLLAAGATPVIFQEIRNAHSGPRTTPAMERIKGQLFGLSQLVDAGNATPEAAWETRYWTRAMGDYDAVIAGTDLQAVNAAKAWMGDKATFHARSQKEFASLQGFQILAHKNLASDRVELKYQFAFQNLTTPPETKIVEMDNDNGAWRCAQTRSYDAGWDEGSEPEPQP